MEAEAPNPPLRAGAQKGHTVQTPEKHARRFLEVQQLRQSGETCSLGEV